MTTKARILAVDDEENILHLFKRALEPEGYSVDTALDGATALAKLEATPPDLVILDIKMPDMNGYQVLKQIRQRSNVPVIMVTGVREAVSLDRALDIGADDYITKPFHIKELIARVQAKLRRSQAGGGVGLP
ncbi:MAG: response regulator transcription factor [Chloroflexi bacterium]|nr:response regulator transcription factor [Chloroflexota bacterium]